MHKFIIFSILLIVLMHSSCSAPGAVKSHSLYASDSKNSWRVSNVLPDSVLTPENRIIYRKLSVCWGNNLMMIASCEEYPDVIVANLYVYNSDSTISIYFDPNEFHLKDASSIMLRMKRPYEAANLLIAQTSSMPPYTPKYNYKINYNSSTSADVVAKEDPWHKLGYSLSAYETERRNKHLMGLAGYFYDEGLIPTEIPPNTAITGLLFWSQKTKNYPLTLQGSISSNSVEMVFDSVMFR